MEYCNKFVWWAHGCFFGALFFAIFFFVCAILTFKDSKKDKSSIGWGIFAIVIGVVVFFALCPARIEQHTETVTLTHFDSSHWWCGENRVCFEVDGEEHWVKPEDGQRDMYEMLMGKEVVLTYGKLHTFVDDWLGIHPFDDNEWRYGDISLPTE